jgi:hypothetical protein
MNWFIPIYMALSVSLRPAYQEGEPFDYLARLGAMYATHGYSVEWEREEGDYYLNYAGYGERGLGGRYRLAYSTEVIDSKGIDRQMAGVMRDFELWNKDGQDKQDNFFSAGFTIVAHEYRDPGWAVRLGAPLPGDGSVTWTTDFNRVHIWDAETRYHFAGAGKMIRPYVEGHVLHDRRTYWRGEVGVEIRLVG